MNCPFGGGSGNGVACTTLVQRLALTGAAWRALPLVALLAAPEEAAAGTGGTKTYGCCWGGCEASD